MDLEALRRRQCELVELLARTESPIELARASGELENLNRQLERAQSAEKETPSED
ncbi:hypothetical protein GCM10027417_07740 [Glutamicibacter endophyticus]